MNIFDTLVCKPIDWTCSPTDASEEKSTEGDGSIPGPPEANSKNARFKHEWLSSSGGPVYMGSWDVESNRAGIKSRKGIVLYNHAEGSHVHDTQIEVDLIWALADKGFVVVAADLPGSGRTGEHPDSVEGEEAPESVDVAMAVTQKAQEDFKDKKGKDLKIFALGHTDEGFYIAPVEVDSESDDQEQALKAAILVSFSAMGRMEMEGPMKDILGDTEAYLLKRTQKKTAIRRLSTAIMGGGNSPRRASTSV
jgi:hypothetical protein